MANYVLEILDGDRAGEVLPVGASIIRIGRKAGNDIVLTDEKTSGVHCEILPEGDRLVLKDLGSTNGTFLDGKRLSELVLTPGDIVTIGRTRVIFRAENDEVAADTGEFAMRTLDAGKLQKRGSSVGLLFVLFLVLAGGGGWYWFQGQQQNDGGSIGPKASRTPLAVANNRIQAALASCEAEEGWNLRVAGLGFRTGGQPHTGSSSFTAYRGDELDATAGGDAGAAVPKSDDDFAVLQLAEPLDVFAGRTLTVVGHCKTAQGGLVALRAKVFASNEEVPFRFCHGTKMAAYDDDWQRIEVMVTVPSGCDRLLLEVVAVLPNPDSEALCDDVAVLDGGKANGIDVPLPEAGQTAFGFGSSLAVHASDPSNPGTVLQILPDSVPAAWTRLHQAGYCVLSDLGAELTCAAEPTGFALAATGVTGLQFVLPAGAAAGLLVATGDGFAAASAQSEFEAQRVLFGSHATRGMLQFAADTKLHGVIGGGQYRLSCAAASVSLMVGFRKERQQAGQFVSGAQTAHAEGRPGQALDELATMLAQVPMDSASLQKAQELRLQVLNEQAAQVSELRQDLEEADFFKTRGGFERVAAGVEQLISLYGKHNIEDLAGVEALHQKAAERLTALDRATFEVQRKRLGELADAFASAQQTALQKMVSDYVARHLNGGSLDGK